LKYYYTLQMWENLHKSYTANFRMESKDEFVK